MQRDIASSTPNIKRVFAYSPQCQVSDPVATSEAVEGEPEVLVVATTHVPNASTLPSNTRRWLLASNLEPLRTPRPSLLSRVLSSIL